MQRKIAAIICSLVLLTGCGASKIMGGQQALKPNPDSCGSRKLNDAYYDFRTDTCVMPKTNEEMDIFSTYAQVYRLAQAGDEVTPFSVAFSSSVPMGILQGFLSSFGDAPITFLSLYFPKVSHGLSSGTGFEKAVPASEAIERARIDFTARHKQPSTDFEKEMKDGAAIAFEKGEVDIYSLDIILKPSTVLAWWKEHPDLVERAYPKESKLPWPYESWDFSKMTPDDIPDFFKKP